MKRSSFSPQWLVRCSVWAAAVLLVAGPASAQPVLRIAKYTIAQADQKQVFQLTDQINKLYAKSKAFQWLKLSYDPTTGEYLAVSLWKSRSDMEAVLKDEAFKALLAKMKPLMKGDFSAKTYQIYEPKK